MRTKTISPVVAAEEDTGEMDKGIGIPRKSRKSGYGGIGTKTIIPRSGS